MLNLISHGIQHNIASCKKYFDSEWS